MINELINRLKDKKICILGFGAEGQSTYAFIRKHLPEQHLTICDKASISAPTNNVTVISGEDYLNELDSFDIIMKSPGISLKNTDISNIQDKIYSQIELFLEFAPCRTVGITGTKGKSTTSSLIYAILQDQNIPSLLAGNIGTPVFDFLEKLTSQTVVVLELSSHQLEFTHHSPKIAILLNIFEEHLDHYTSFEEYKNAKFNIARFQDSSDFFLYKPDITLPFTSLAKRILIADSGETIGTELRGEHNQTNIRFVLEVSKILNLDIEKTLQTVKNFHGLPHRLEYLGNFSGIDFYDDAIATIPEATIGCVMALGGIDTLIIGGMDRGIDYSGLIDFLNTGAVENVICMPNTGLAIMDRIINANTYPAETLNDAVLTAKKITPQNGVCVLSPAAASYGFYKNFQEKGNEFKRLVALD